jgi:hypothetical protein
MYFEGADLTGLDASESNPGVGVAFAKTDGNPIVSADQVLAAWSAGTSLADHMARLFLDLSVRSLPAATAREVWSLPAPSIRNPEHVEFLLDANIVIERSPPEWAPLKMLIRNSNTITVGTMVGAAALTYPLMLITVPVGIIIVGAARGISKGLENGLNKRIEKALRTRRRPGRQ